MSFKCSYEFRMMKRSLKTVPEKLSRKTYINRENKSRSSQFSYTVIVVT